MEGNIPVTLIIAEAGTGHVGPNDAWRRVDAQILIEAAAKAGADMVKFQAFFDEPLFCPVEGDEKRRERWRNTFLSPGEWLNLHQHAKEAGIDLILSVFSETGVKLLKEMKPRYVKVASRAANSFPYHELEGPFIISTGMGKPDYVDAAWLQCTSSYPSGMVHWIAEFEGLSDHSGTIWPGLDAIFRGARFLEVHFTVPGTDPGPDRPVCLDFDQLKLLCEARDAAATMHGNIGGVEKADTGTS